MFAPGQEMRSATSREVVAMRFAAVNHESREVAENGPNRALLSLVRREPESG
jgi:hypothetical protein